MGYKFDKSLRWFKEVSKFDSEIKNWKKEKFWIMREAIELGLRFGKKPYNIPLVDFGVHVGMTRQTCAKYLRELSGWLIYRAGKFTGCSATITVNWEKLDKLYKTHESKFKRMETEQESVNPVNAVESVKVGAKSVKVGAESVNAVNDKEKDKKRDKEKKVLQRQIDNLLNDRI